MRLKHIFWLIMKKLNNFEAQDGVMFSCSLPCWDLTLWQSVIFFRISFYKFRLKICVVDILKVYQLAKNIEFSIGKFKRMKRNKLKSLKVANSEHENLAFRS